MKIDWNRGTIDFSKNTKPVAVELTPLRMLIGAAMIPLGLIIGWIGYLSVVHELGHAIGIWLSGGGARITWDYCYSTYAHYGKVQIFIASTSGCFFGTIVWTFIATLMMKRLPEFSIFPMAYAVGEVFNVAYEAYDVMNDLYNRPVGTSIVFIGMLGCVIFYVMRLTGGLRRWRTKDVVLKEKSK